MTGADEGAALEPVVLAEDQAGDRFLLYTDAKGVQLDIRYEGDRLWLTQAQMVQLFGRDVSVISRHIANVFAEDELDEPSNLQKMQSAHSTRPITLYSLDLVISVGYRVSSREGTLFRRWATERLVRFAAKGFVIDAARLKRPDAVDRLAELREIIRDIRSDEANVYRELRRICAMCQDYDPRSDASREFYARTQAKLVWAVTSRTPSELIVERASADAPDMGLTNWPHASIRKADVTTAKSYLADGELRELNRLTNILLDIFEDQLDIGRLTLMRHATEVLDRNLTNLGRQVLRDGGRLTREAANAKAEREYARFKAEEKRVRHNEADAAIAAVKRVGKRRVVGDDGE